MKKTALIFVAGFSLIALSGCAGPMNFSRGFDDWVNQTYVESPWLGQVLLYTGIIPVVTVFTHAVDYAVLNVVDFWGESAFKGVGTPFIHRNPATPEPR